jgi:hypothetical protein
MTDQNQYRQQQNQPPDARSRPADPPPATAPPAYNPTPAYTPPPADVTQDSKTKTRFKLSEEKRAAGKAGEQNLRLQWINVSLGSADSARFNVQTAQGNALEVTIEQTAYNRTYSGTGTVATSVVPVAPIGTKGKVTAIDTTTGETIEQKFTWHDVGGSAGFWEMIKRLFWKG